MSTSLLEKYRPSSLAEVRGQDGVVRALGHFLADPHPGAWLFHGPSGVGKTCTARALGAGLGIAVEQGDLGGLYEIASGEMTADSVREAMRRLAFRPMMGSGWRMLLCNEADRMTSAAETVWLDALERVPNQSLICFTTNAPERLTRRLRDRCEVLAFEHRTEELLFAIRAFARDVWERETGGEVSCPGLAELGRPTLSGPDGMHPSFRLALQQLSQYLREWRAGGGGEGLERVQERLGTPHEEKASEPEVVPFKHPCRWCGKDNPVKAGQRLRICTFCRKQYRVPPQAWAS